MDAFTQPQRMPKKLNLKDYPLSLYALAILSGKMPHCDFNFMWQRQLTPTLRNGRPSKLDFSKTVAEHFSVDHRNIELKSLFFWGRTPSLMPPQITAEIIDRAAGLFKIVTISKLRQK